MKSLSKIFKDGRLLLGSLAVVLLFALFSVTTNTFANVTTEVPTPSSRFQQYTFFATSTAQVIDAGSLYATSTSATSTNIAAWTDANGRIDRGYFVINGASAINVYFSRGGVTGPNVGTSTFKVQVTTDGSTWYDYNKLITNVTNTNAQNLTRVGSIALGNDTGTGTSTSIVSIDPTDSFYAIRCIVIETTDGEHSCKATARY